MIFTAYRFRFSLLGSILTIVGISVFFSLGSWQIKRAEGKQALQDSIDSRKNAVEIIMRSSMIDLQNIYYSPVRAVGHYDVDYEILIDSEVHQGRAGYHVLTPLVLSDEQAVIMVNRGWVPVGRSRQVLPNISVPSGELTVFGVISPHKSKPALILDKANLGVTKVWAYFDADAYALKTGYNLLPAVILMDENKGNGYIRDWPKYNAKVGMHLGYAVQWYFFAAVVFFTYLAVNFKKKSVSHIAGERGKTNE